MNASEVATNELGYFGNIWVRSNYLLRAGYSNGGGHYHYFDHVTLLVKGSLSVEIEGHEPKEFKAPTFIVVKKEHRHKMTALEDDTLYYCVFALRDVDGNVTDIYSGDNSPYGYAQSQEEALTWLANKTQSE